MPILCNLILDNWAFLRTRDYLNFLIFHKTVSQCHICYHKNSTSFKPNCLSKQMTKLNLSQKLNIRNLILGKISFISIKLQSSSLSPVNTGGGGEIRKRQREYSPHLYTGHAASQNSAADAETPPPPPRAVVLEILHSARACSIQ